MADSTRKPELWVDELVEKHECGGYDGYSLTTEIVHEGRALTLIHPDSLEEAEYLSATLSENRELLYLIAKQPRPGGDFKCAAILIVARRREPDRYATVVRHEIIPWALKYLGLAGEAES